MKTCLLTIIFLFSVAFCKAQPTALRDSFIHLNDIRIETNKIGMDVLGGWGIANIAVGGVGYFRAKDREWKAFHGMNSIWGIVNTGIAISGMAGTRKEMSENLSCNNMLLRYEGYKRLYLINISLDILYTGAGIYLTEQAKARRGDIEQQRGFGKALMLQGIFLFVFDNTMFAIHQHYNKRWYRLLNGLCVTDNGLGLNYTF